MIRVADIWRFMVYHRNMEPSCIITGSSTHNERIERLWCDVFRCVGQIFYSLLYGLEDDGFLDPLNDTDLFCVHLAILPEVNRCLKEFVESWNQHCLSSEHNMTPDALYTLGLLERKHTETENPPTGRSLNSIDLSRYGMEDMTVVDIPPTPQSVCSVLQCQLLRISNNAMCDDFGLNLYKETIRAV